MAKSIAAFAIAQLPSTLAQFQDTVPYNGYDYFLAEKSQSCQEACSARSQICSLKAIVAVANISTCKALVDEMGRPYSRSGTYRGDVSGCTYGDWGTADNQWVQVMRKDNADPTCEQVNSDPTRQRMCACEPIQETVDHDGDSYFLAEGSQSCDDACAEKAQVCSLDAIQKVAEISVCKSLVDAMNRPYSRSGTYPGDVSGCTYGDWGTDDNRWVQVLRKDDQPPTCEQVNSDPTRRRMCSCKAVKKEVEYEGFNYFLAEKSQSCSDACAARDDTCNLEAVKKVAEITVCRGIIDDMGRHYSRSGTYGGDISGCTYGDWGTVDNRWVQVMRKDDADPTCEQVNPDPTRQRLCACGKDVHYEPAWQYNNAKNAFDCDCKPATWETGMLSASACSSAWENTDVFGSGSQRCSSAKAPTTKYFAKTWGWNAALGGHACACGEVAWTTEFTSAADCVEAWTKEGTCVAPRVLRATLRGSGFDARTQEV